MKWYEFIVAYWVVVFALITILYFLFQWWLAHQERMEQVQVQLLEAQRTAYCLANYQSKHPFQYKNDVLQFIRMVTLTDLFGKHRYLLRSEIILQIEAPSNSTLLFEVEEVERAWIIFLNEKYREHK